MTNHATIIDALFGCQTVMQVCELLAAQGECDLSGIAALCFVLQPLVLTVDSVGSALQLVSHAPKAIAQAHA